MELDALYRTVRSGEFVALDITTGSQKHFHEVERTEKLNMISEALEQEIILIDIALVKKPFRFEQNTERMYRWILPCTIDFHQIMSDIVPDNRVPKTHSPVTDLFAKH